tara:strand:- start:1661 stop:3040 length:1380 start_codon:yes stop_codon:yes gene_type:complete
MTSTIKVDNIQKTSDGSNIIKKCGSTITIGSSGQTVAVACGATTSGMGRTGTVDWCTTAKTSPFTAVSGDGFFVNTTSGAITVTLPSSPSAGDIVAFADYANTWQTNNVTVCRNGSKINSQCNNAVLKTEGQSVTLIYVDGTRGWKNVQDSTSNVSGQPNFIVATGGTITTSGDFKIHTFTSDGTFTIDSAPTPGNNNVSYMVVGGGGGGSGAGGGAGGFREGKTPATPYTASPIVAPAGLPVSIQAYPITVGGGGAGSPNGYPTAGTVGSASIFSSISSAGGGFGGVSPSPSPGGDGGNGGSGGGAGNHPSGSACVGAGNTPPVSPPQGNPGGISSPAPAANIGMGGGGGATGNGGNGSVGPAPTKGNAGAGGTGASTEITGSAVARAGGGGGGSQSPSACAAGGGTAGTGGGSAGAQGASAANPATVNTGGGGGGTVGGLAAGTGGSGIIVIRYKFQ